MGYVVVSEKNIRDKVSQLALVVAKDYKGKRPIVIGVLTGSYILMADFTRALWQAGFTTFDVDFIGVSSYGSTKQSSKQPKLTKHIQKDVKGKNVLIVEDVVDTGITIDFLLKYFQTKNPKSVKVLALLSKPGKREVAVKIDYLGFEIGNDWVEGYGLDGGDCGRACPEIRKVK